MLNSPNFTEGHDKFKILAQESHIYTHICICIQMGLVIRITLEFVPIGKIETHEKVHQESKTLEKQTYKFEKLLKNVNKL